MRKLEELINQLCPDGVEYKVLGKLCSVVTKQTGFDYTNYIKASLLTEETIDSVPYIQTKFFAGKQFYYETDYFVPKTIVEKFPKITLDEKCLLFSIVGASIGNVGLFPGVRRCFLGGAICVAKVLPIHNVDYIYYCIESSHIQKQISKKIKGAGQATVTIEDIRNFTIPLPPLPIQEEIVRILDNMTSLTAELTAELKARQKQYEYYRDSLLNFDEGNAQGGVRWMKLGEVCDFVRGPFGGSLKKEIFTKSGYAVYEQQHAIYGKFEFRYFIDDKKFNELKRFAVKSKDLIMSCSGTMGKVSIIPDNAPAGVINQALLKLTPKDFMSAVYLKYYFETTITKLMNDNAKGGAIKNVAGVAELKNIDIPVPSLEEQQRIVDILDRFDKLCNDISEGLPAEIEARKKQYEYYRDKLLTFREKEG